MRHKLASQDFACIVGQILQALKDLGYPLASSYHASKTPIILDI